MKTNQQNKLIKAGFFALTFALSSSGFALGIYQSVLEVKCDGILEIKGVNDIGSTTSFYDRAGHFHPSQGYATLNVIATKLNPLCSDLQNIGVNLDTQKFEAMEFFSETNQAAIEALASAMIGKTYSFHTQQYYGLVDSKGFLPFYPLASPVSVTVQTQDKLYLTMGAYIPASEPKSFLTEEEKVEVTEAIFAQLAHTNYQEDALNNSSLYYLVEKHPYFSFKDYLAKLLKVFSLYENKALSSQSDSTFDIPLSVLAQGISGLTHSYPEYYDFDLPTLVAEHPSLLRLSTEIPQISAVDLEKALKLLDGNLKAKSVSEKVKRNFEEPLRTIAGHNSLGGKLQQISSQQAKDLAEEILNSDYSH